MGVPKGGREKRAEQKEAEIGLEDIAPLEDPGDASTGGAQPRSRQTVQQASESPFAQGRPPSFGPGSPGVDYLLNPPIPPKSFWPSQIARLDAIKPPSIIDA